MIKFKNISKIVSSIAIASFLFIGCSTTVEEIPTVRLESADEVIEKFNEYNLDNNVLEMVKLYSDAYIDSTGSTLNYINDTLSQNRDNIEITQSKLIQIEDISENVKKATIEIEAVIDGEALTDQYVYAVIKEENGWAISPEGVLSTENFDAGVYNEDELNLALGKKIEMLDANLLRISVLNNSEINYTFGIEENKCEVIVESATEIVTTTMEEVTIVEEGLNSYFLSRMDYIEDEIEKITVTNIYKLDEDLNPIESTREDIVVYSK